MLTKWSMTKKSRGGAALRSVTKNKLTSFRKHWKWLCNSGTVLHVKTFRVHQFEVLLLRFEYTIVRVHEQNSNVGHILRHLQFIIFSLPLFLCQTSWQKAICFPLVIQWWWRWRSTERVLVVRLRELKERHDRSSFVIQQMFLREFLWTLSVGITMRKKSSWQRFFSAQNVADSTQNRHYNDNNIRKGIIRIESKHGELGMYIDWETSGRVRFIVSVWQYRLCRYTL